MLAMLPTIFQVLLGLMSFADKLNAPGAAKKGLVMQGLASAAPAIVATLPQSTQRNIQDEAPQVQQIITVASELIDGLHAVAKKHNLYPQIDAVLVEAQTDIKQVQAIATSAMSAD